MSFAVFPIILRSNQFRRLMTVTKFKFASTIQPDSSRRFVQRREIHLLWFFCYFKDFDTWILLNFATFGMISNDLSILQGAQRLNPPLFVLPRPSCQTPLRSLPTQSAQLFWVVHSCWLSLNLRTSQLETGDIPTFQVRMSQMGVSLKGQIPIFLWVSILEWPFMTGW